MPNRLTDTTIWKNQKWFKKLPPLYKLAWKYLTDTCDHAGFWKVDLSELLDDIGVDEFDFDDFMITCNNDYNKRTGKQIHRHRIMKISDTEIWITGFIQFQYGKKNGKLVISFNATKSAIELLIIKDLYTLAVDNKYICIDYKPPTRSHHHPPPPTYEQEQGAEGSYECDAPNSISISNNKEDVFNTPVNTEAGKQKKSFNQYPTEKDSGLELPESKIKMIIQYYQINKNTTKSVGQVKVEFEFFKQQHFTGNKFYFDESQIFEHFMNIIKKEQSKPNGYNKNNSGRVIEAVPAGGFGKRK